MKEDSSGGRKDRKIELGMKFMERRMDDDEHDEHSSKRFHISITTSRLCLTILLLQTAENRGIMTPLRNTSSMMYSSHDGDTWEEFKE